MNWKVSFWRQTFAELNCQLQEFSCHFRSFRYPKLSFESAPHALTFQFNIFQKQNTLNIIWLSRTFGKEKEEEEVNSIQTIACPLQKPNTFKVSTTHMQAQGILTAKEDFVNSKTFQDV